MKKSKETINNTINNTISNTSNECEKENREIIVRDHAKDFLLDILPKDRGILKELRDYGEEHHVPIVEEEVAALIKVLTRTSGAKNVLEIGTAIGYSGCIFLEAMGEGGKLTTIERNEEMLRLAGENFRKAGRENSVRILPGDALEILHYLKGDYDLIFLDGAKGHYREMLDLTISLLKPGGLLISDNILFKGMVTGEHPVKRRKRTIVNRMRDYLKYICDHPLLDTSIIPIGDGVALSYRKNEVEQKGLSERIEKKEDSE